MSAEAFDALESRAQEGNAVYLKGRLSGQVFRVSPVRDPDQPRLWCLLVERRATVGIVGRRLEAVIGPGGLTLDQAQAALRELAANPAEWLGQARHRRLRGWLCRLPVAADPADAKDAVRPG